MTIFIIGQCTLHWGRMEFGNIGNYYIIEPFIRELRKVFPQCKIKTTFQFSDRFCNDENVDCLPMHLYYGFVEQDLTNALAELASAESFNKHGFLPWSSPYIEEVMSSDMVIDFSGDIWGDNADFLGKDRFFVGLIKDRIAQLMGKKTVMLAGSPGPFGNEKILSFAKEVFENVDLVTNRESISIGLLEQLDFRTDHVESLACPAFLFEPKFGEETDIIFGKYGLAEKKSKVGFIICGWSFLEGPFDKSARQEEEFTVFAEAVEYICNELQQDVLLISHSNGFPIPPLPFRLNHGRDFIIMEQLKEILDKRGLASKYSLVTDVMDTWTTKALIGRLKLLVSGRIHGAVAGLSQLVPTVIIDYGHEPKAHKLKGFAIEAGVEELIADPAIKNDVIHKIDKCWKEQDDYQKRLEQHIPQAQTKARKNFELLKSIVDI